MIIDYGTIKDAWLREWPHHRAARDRLSDQHLPPGDCLLISAPPGLAVTRRGAATAHC
jgi:hypothetical protein